MLVSILRVLCRLVFRVRVAGLEHIPSEDRLLIIANHESLLDGMLIGLFLPKRATFVVHSDVLKNPVFRWILSLTPHLAVNPTSPLAMKKVIQRLNAGENVVIFPEGRITSTGALMKVYDGPGFVAAKTGVRILPIRVEGAAQSYFGRLSAAHPRKLFPKVMLTIMPPTEIRTESQDKTPLTSKQRRRIAGAAMRNIMQNMLFQTQPNKTLFETFLDAIDKSGSSMRIIEDLNLQEETYRDLLKKSLALGRLACKVSKPNQAVGVLMPNITNTAGLILGMMAFKRIPAMLNYTSGTAGIQNACIAAKINTIMTSRQFLETAKLQEVVAQLKDIKIVYLEDLRPQFGLLDRAWLIGYALHFPRAAMEKIHAEDTAVILFTSGSEGKPKGVVHSHKSILANIHQIMATLDFNPTDKFMMSLPMFHAFGFTGTLLPLLSGIRIMLFPSPLQYRVIPEVIYEKNCTVFISTSTFLANYAKFAHPYDFYKLRIVVAGAEKLNEEVRKVYHEKFGIRILEGYGTTECAPVVSANTPMANKQGTVGQFFPGIAHKLEPVAGIENGGLLYVKGDNIMQGYYLYDQPGKLIPPPNGWYDTGDVVEVDQEGFIHIKGRVKRFAKVAGEMVSLETVEKIANTAAPDHKHAATTQANANRGENIVLFTTDAALKREDLQVVAKNLGAPEIAIARKIIVVENIPLLGTGKTDYVTLKQMAEEQ
ncbi:MAG TPA: bifunctional acyl-ACP--phospholipid O-acyltransferase/long-chain-fatty-acid--ACP ligase [Methylophilus sp.]|uniref:bifunctional acyl-ACP--phospholipid O-acyltransferase/long-chain-fatty-acid--ACP ligase n=1 Tax=Methylophilus sp. TaxID=29541 RepID=UPI002BEC0121|nr:bifunctional acyl-ACP--phospholipid O-acyltransferase/long-chain-fatty-acid--ACP ligase [Methylophilus sp.]HSH86498.1 bifunctional acyl-ACP--phospholipid O-acyltransferase/long-chain-fatty-acid--ACP ligase [Methylophilus sp.]